MSDESVFAVSTPTSSEVSSPGPAVTAIASGGFCFSKTSASNSDITSVCLRAATSGTMPP